MNRNAILRTAAALVGLIGSVAAAVAATQETKSADVLGRMQGTWRVVSAQTDGETAPADRLAAIRVTIQGQRVRVVNGDETLHEGPFRLDASASPMTVDDTIEQEDGSTIEIHGIFKLVDDILTSCTARPGEPRPTDFEAKPGSGHTLRRLERVKDDDPAVAAELKKFEGTWRYASLTVEGQAVPLSTIEATRLVLTGNRFEMTDGQTTYRGTFHVDPSARPRTFDVVFTEGPEAGTTTRGIYELEGDTLRECVSLRPDDAQRPAAFASSPNSGLALQVLERVKPAP